MGKETYLFRRRHMSEKAAFPVIDAHNHLWGNWQVEKIVKAMDMVGVISYCDVTGNVQIEFSKGGYVIKPGNIYDFFKNCPEKYPGRFYCFTMAGFAHSANEPLFTDDKKFVSECIEALQEHTRLGAKGLKILKELGLHYRDSQGDLINVDDHRLAPIWEEAARLKIGL